MLPTRIFGLTSLLECFKLQVETTILCRWKWVVYELAAVIRACRHDESPPITVWAEKNCTDYLLSVSLQ